MSLVYEKVVQEDLNVGTSTGISVTSPTGGMLSGTQIGLHSFSVGQVALTTTWNPDAVAAGSYTTTTITVPGADVGDFVMVSLSTMLTDSVMLSAHVSAANTVMVVLFNPTLASVNLASGTLSVLAFKVRT